jgi:hypothetical protein
MAVIGQEFGHLLAGLLRDYARQKADIQSLYAILNLAVDKDSVPNGWLQSLSQLRETEQYRSVSEEFEPAIREVEKCADWLQIQKLLETTLSTHLQN